MLTGVDLRNWTSLHYETAYVGHSSNLIKIRNLISYIEVCTCRLALTCMANTLQAAFLRACFMASCSPSKSCLCTMKDMTGLWRARSSSSGHFLSTVWSSFSMAADGCFRSDIPPSRNQNICVLSSHNNDDYSITLYTRKYSSQFYFCQFCPLCWWANLILCKYFLLIYLNKIQLCQGLIQDLGRIVCIVNGLKNMGWKITL